MYNWGIVRRVLGTLLFVFFNAAGVEAQASECESFDDDRNGSVEMADEAHPVGINPRNARRGGIDIDGAQPEEMRRGGSLTNPPQRTG